MTKTNKNVEQAFEQVLARIASGGNPKRILKSDEVAEGLTACFINAQNLLEDAFLLASNNRFPRALSLTILALEEIAKIPDLDKQYIDSESQDNTSSWKEFWNRFVRHKPKQKTISAYGNTLKKQYGKSAMGIDNPTPYANYLSENSYEHLDNIKQKQFYVDFSGASFHIPRETKEIKQALDKLFSFADERHHSFSSWHATEQRSLDFIIARGSLLAGQTGEIEAKLRRVFSINEWATTSTTNEKQADLIRLLSYYSSSSIPDYTAFTPTFKEISKKWKKEEIVEIFKNVLGPINKKMDQDKLPTTQIRSSLMFKLLFSYGSRNFTNQENQDVFGIDLNTEIE